MISILIGTLAAAMIRGATKDELELTAEQIAERLWVYWDQLDYLHGYQLETGKPRPVLPPTWTWILFDGTREIPGRVYAFKANAGQWITGESEVGLLTKVGAFGMLTYDIDTFDPKKPLSKQSDTALRVRGKKTDVLPPFAGFTYDAIRKWFKDLVEWEMSRMLQIPEENYVSFHDPSRQGYAMTHERARRVFRVYREMMQTEPDLNQWNRIVQDQNAFYGSPLMNLMITLAAWNTIKPKGGRALAIGMKCSWGIDEYGIYRQYGDSSAVSQIASMLAQRMMEAELEYAQSH